MIEILGLLREWVTYYCYLGFKKSPTILSFIIHRSACDGWAFFQKITMILGMSKRLRISIKFFFFPFMWKRIAQNDGASTEPRLPNNNKTLR
jgi:hypothetical protein